MTNPFFVYLQVKKKYCKSPGSHAFIHEESTAVNTHPRIFGPIVNPEI